MPRSQRGPTRAYQRGQQAEKVVEEGRTSDDEEEYDSIEADSIPDLLQNGVWDKGTPYTVHKCKSFFGMNSDVVLRNEEQRRLTLMGKNGFMVCRPDYCIPLDAVPPSTLSSLRIQLPNTGNLESLLETTKSDDAVFPVVYSEGVFKPSAYLGLAKVESISGNVVVVQSFSGLEVGVDAWESTVSLLRKIKSGEPTLIGDAVRKRERSKEEEDGVVPQTSRLRPTAVVPKPAHTSLTFSLGDGDVARKIWIGAIDSAKERIDLCLYGLNDPLIVKELSRAVRERGVKVRLLIDHSHQVDLGAWHIGDDLDARFVQMQQEGGIVHAKCMLVDDHSLVCGSYNPTTSSVRNWEQCSLLKDKESLSLARKDYDRLWLRCQA